MPRQARKESGTGIYHVMLRDINRQDIFEDAEDYMRMLRCMQQMLEQRARGTGQLRNVGTGICFRDE